MLSCHYDAIDGSRYCAMQHYNYMPIKQFTCCFVDDLYVIRLSYMTNTERLRMLSEQFLA